MKKLSLILLLLVALSLTLAACSQPAVTETVARWGDEKHVFNISKVNWDAPSVTVDDTTFVKNPQYFNEASLSDEIEPYNVGGTYSMEIALQNKDTECVFTTEQNLYVQYETAMLEKLDIWKSEETADGIEDAKSLSDFVVANDDPDCPLEAVENYTILHSHTINTVLFKNEATQRPISSTNKCDGFYLGNIAQEITHYNYSTKYDWDNKKVTVSADGKEESHTLNVNAKIIDSNQILLYARSLEKTSDKMQDNPSIQVFSAVNNKFYTASFGYFTYACKTLLIGPDGKEVPVSINFLSVAVDGSVLLSQMNLPDTVNKEADLDNINNAAAGSSYNKYTTVRFRVGKFNYELQAYDKAVLDAITVAPKSEK